MKSLFSKKKELTQINKTLNYIKDSERENRKKNRKKYLSWFIKKGLFYYFATIGFYSIVSIIIGYIYNKSFDTTGVVILFITILYAIALVVDFTKNIINPFS